MNETLTAFLLVVLVIGVFAVAIWGAYRICVLFEAPKAAKWVVGGLLMIILLFALVYFVQRSPTINRSGVSAPAQLPQYIG